MLGLFKKDKIIEFKRRSVVRPLTLELFRIGLCQ